jgi:hypothetical protein
VSGAIVAAGASLAWTRATALTVAFALCGVLAIVTAIAAKRLPSRVRVS